MTEVTAAALYDRRHKPEQPIADNPAILFARGREVQPLFRTVTGLPRLKDVRAFQVYLVSLSISWDL